MTWSFDDTCIGMTKTGKIVDVPMIAAPLLVGREGWYRLAKEVISLLNKPRPFTGLYDKDGKRIMLGDRLRFLPCEALHPTNRGPTWEGTVTFEDGVYTVDTNGATCIENPANWNREHPWTNSRSWACLVGYGEYGDWNVPRKPLTNMDQGFGHTSEHYKEYYHPICKEHGFDRRYLNARVVAAANDSMAPREGTGR